MQGYTRRKTRSQAQQEIQWGQRRFDGAQNSDTVASKISDTEVALSINTAHTASDIQGHWGRKLLSPEATPGTGRLHQVSQHPKTGRWLVHRGNKLWLSTGRDGTGWNEVSPLGPDGSLEATGMFGYADVAVSGDLPSYLSGMMLTGLIEGQTVYIEFENDIGLYIVRVYSDMAKTILVSAGNISSATSLPATITLTQQGSSGIAGVVTADTDPVTVQEGPGVATIVNRAVAFTLRGLTLDNTDAWDLYWKIVVSVGGTAYTITLYKDSGMTSAVAEAIATGSALESFVTPLNGSGISGSAELDSSVPLDGTYTGSVVEFSVVEESVDADSTISAYGETGFIVFSRGTDPHNIYVDQDLRAYWFLSTVHGYGEQPVGGSASGDPYKYRYLYTYSRIINPETMEPDYSGDRISALLKLEGPSNVRGDESTDYGQQETSLPIGPPDTVSIPLTYGANVPIGLAAAAYITHISIYRTMDVGVNGIGINGAANNSELYIWVADVPIYSTEYTDGTDDATLRNRLVGASTEQDSLALRSRLFREMARGIGAIGPDFMVTAEPQAQQASYCDIAANPRLIGFNFPGTQRFILQDPISEIYRTKDLFVFLCPSSTYTSLSNVQQETGIAGLIPIVTIQNFEPASRTVGIKYGQGIFPVDESSFITLCSDGTVRIFSAGSWSDPLESVKLHGITSQIRVGAVFSLFRGVMLMWGRQTDGDGAADTCLRYVFGPANPNGSQWTEVSRPYWAYPGSWCGAMLVEDENAELRVGVFDYLDGAVFAVEDSLPLRQFEDDAVTVTTGGLTGDATEFITAMALSGITYLTDYDVVIIGITPDIMGVYIVDGVTTLAQYEGPIAGQPLVDAVLAEVGGSGISGTFSISGFTGGYVYGVFGAGGVIVSAAVPIPSLLRLRELTGAQENYQCAHMESHIAFRPRYERTALPAGLEVTVRGYADGVLCPGAETVVPPDNSDIQFFAPVEGERIQIEYETNKSGWRITSTDTKYNSRDMQAPDGPWNGQEAEYQAALGDGLASWLYGSSGLVDRASDTNSRYTGSVPDEIDGPGGTYYGQNFAAPVERAINAELQDYTLMFWVLGPAIVPAVLQAGTLGVAFPLASYIDAGDGLGATVDPEVFTANGWQHFAVVRDGLTRKIYQNGVEIATADNIAPVVDAAVMTVGSADGAMPLCDVRLYDNAKTAAVLGYYYNDVATNEGRKVLP